MFKTRLNVVIIICLTNIFVIHSQEVDTVIYSNDGNYSHLWYRISDGDWESFESLTIDLKVEESDTIKNKIERDTFSIRLINNYNDTRQYELKLSKSFWTKTLLGKNCHPDWWDEIKTPTLIFKHDESSTKLNLDSCKSNIEIIEAAFKYQLQCIENSDDKLMKKYVEEWLQEISSCEFQGRMLLTQVSQLFSRINNIIPIDSTIKYTLTPRKDSLKFLTLHQIVTKRKGTNNTIIYKISEDLEKEESVTKRFMEGISEVFKDDVPADEKEKFSKRIASMKEIDYEEVIITDDKKLILFTRHLESARLNSQMKNVQSKFDYSIKRIN